MVALRCQTVTLSTVNLFTLAAGEERIPLVILHGFASSALDWVPVIESLGQERLVLAYDRPGFGLSTVRSDTWSGRNPYTPSTQPILLSSWLEVLGLERVVLLGHSMGARLAYDFAQTHPERVQGLILVTPAWRYLRAPRLALWLQQPLFRWLTPRFLRISAPLFWWAAQRRVWGDPRSRPKSEGVIAARIAGWESSLWNVVVATLADNSLQMAPEAPPPMPTQVVLGGRDRIVQNAVTTRLVACWSEQGGTVRLKVFPESGHLPHVEAKAQFLDVVRAFLQEVENAAAYRW